MTNISVFQFNSSDVRVEILNNEPFFCLTDVVSILDIKNANPSRFKLSIDGIHKMYSVDSLGRKNEITFINEQNLYRVIFRSNKKEAVQFQNWVFDEVLPQIRKTGSYVAHQALTHTITVTDDELCSLLWLWNASECMRRRIEHVEPGLRALSSSYAGTFWSMAHEYKRTINAGRDVIRRITNSFDINESRSRNPNWRTLEDIRQSK